MANGVPIEVVFVSEEGEILGASGLEVDTDDFNRPIPAMGDALCSSLDGPECWAMNYEIDSDEMADGGEANELGLSQDQLAAVFDVLKSKFDLDEDFRIDINGEVFHMGDMVGAQTDADAESLFLTNEEIVHGGILQSETGFSRVYQRPITKLRQKLIPEEHAVDVETLAERLGMPDEYVDPLAHFWSNLEDPNYEYQVFVLDQHVLEFDELLTEVRAAVADPGAAEQARLSVYMFLIDFDGFKPFDLRLVAPAMRHLVEKVTVSQQEFLEELLETLLDMEKLMDPDAVDDALINELLAEGFTEEEIELLNQVADELPEGMDFSEFHLRDDMAELQAELDQALAETQSLLAAATAGSNSRAAAASVEPPSSSSSVDAAEAPNDDANSDSEES